MERDIAAVVNAREKSGHFSLPEMKSVGFCAQWASLPLGIWGLDDVTSLFVCVTLFRCGKVSLYAGLSVRPSVCLPKSDVLSVSWCLLTFFYCRDRYR